MSDTTTTTTGPKVTVKDLQSLAKAVTTFASTTKDRASEALTAIHEAAVVQAEPILALYDAFNQDARKGKTDPKDMSWGQFWKLLSGAATLVEFKDLPDETIARKLWTIGRFGSTKSARMTFLRAASKHGLDVTLDGYVRFCARIDDFKSNGELTDEAADRERKAEQAKREERKVREAAKSSRPLAFDFSSLFASHDCETDRDRIKFLMLLKQECDMAIKAIAADLDKSAVRKATDEAAKEITRHAVKK